MLLSVCVPTYNRPKRIAELLGNLVPIIERNGLLSSVEICISDNSPEKATRDVVSAAKAKTRARIVYHQNGENIGFDRNVLKAFSLARAQYAHLISDEDVYDGRAFLDILARLRHDAPDSVVFTSLCRNNTDLGKSIRLMTFAKGEFLSRMFSQKNRGIQQFAYMPSMIIRRKLLAGAMRIINRNLGIFVGTWHMHSPIYVYAAKNSRRILVYSESFKKPEKFLPAAHVVTFPSAQVTLYHVQFPNSVIGCCTTGMISRAERDLFMKSYLPFELYHLLYFRVFIYPGIYDLEVPKMRSTLKDMKERYGLGAFQSIWVGAYIGIILSRLPWHLIYSAWILFKKALRMDNIIDVHKAYAEYLAGQKNLVSVQDWLK